MINSNSQRPLTLSREDLYELVWSKPMQELAKDFGISDVALAKRMGAPNRPHQRGLQPKLAVAGRRLPRPSPLRLRNVAPRAS